MLTIGDYQIDEGKIAPPVVNRLLQRAIAHILNNEASASVLGKTKRAIAGKDGKPEDVTPEQLAAFRDSETGAAQIATWEDEFCQAKIASMYDGTLSVRASRGPTRDPIEQIMRQIAKLEVTATLKANGAKFPTKDETVTLGDQVYTGDELIDRRLNAELFPEHAARIRKLAERKHAEDKRLRDAAEKAATGGEGLAGL